MKVVEAEAIERSTTDRRVAEVQRQLQEFLLRSDERSKIHAPWRTLFFSVLGVLVTALILFLARQAWVVQSARALPGGGG